MSKGFKLIKKQKPPPQKRSCPVCGKVTKFQYSVSKKHGACKRCGFFLQKAGTPTQYLWAWTVMEIERIRDEYNEGKTAKRI